MTTRGNETPAGAGHDTDDTAPAGTSSDDDREAQRDAWRRVRASYRRTVRGPGRRTRAARGTLPDRPGMIRRPPPDGDDAA